MTENIKRKTIFIGRDRCLEQWCGKPCRKMRWEILRISTDRFVYFPAGGNTMYYETPGELFPVYAQIVLKCLYLARIGRPEFLRSVDTLARSVTKWDKVCDKKVAKIDKLLRSLQKLTAILSCASQIEDCKLSLFQDVSFASHVCKSKSTSGCLLCVFGTHTCVPISWMCKKEIAFLHSRSESGLFRLTVWMVHQLFGFGSVSWEHYPVSQPTETLSVTNARESISLIHILKSVFESIDHVLPSIPNSSHSTQLHLFEDNAAVTQVFDKGRRRSPNLRHVPGTHRVDLDWLFETVNVWIILLR